jgi:saposin
MEVKPELMAPLVKPQLLTALVTTHNLVKLVPAGVQPDGEIECTICKLILGYVEDKLGSNSSVAEVEKFLEDDVCGLLPSFLQPECDSLVEEYAPELAQKIADKYPAGKICASVHLCSASSSLAVDNKKLIEELKEKSQADPLACSICELVVGYVEDDLQKNSTLASIEKDLNNVCSKLPKFLQTGCLGLVAKYAPDLAPLIVKHDPPAVACGKVDLCPKNNSAIDSLLMDLVLPIAKMQVKPELLTPLVKPQLLTALVKPSLMVELVPANTVKPLTLECDICKLVTGYLEDKIDTNATLAKIETFLNTTVCDLFPSFLRVECAALVDQYGPEIAQRFKNKDTPSEICTHIGVCSNSSSVTPLVELVPAVRPELMMPLVKTSNLVELVEPIAEMDVRPELMMPLEAPHKEGAVECAICKVRKKQQKKKKSLSRQTLTFLL